MAAIPGSNFSAPVVPNDTQDVFPTHLAQYGQGGLRTVQTLADRDAITTERRDWLMEVNVLADGKKYTLKPSLSSLNLADNGNWAELVSGAVPGVTLWKQGAQIANRLVLYNGVIYLVKQDIANSMSSPDTNTQYYQSISSDVNKAYVDAADQALQTQIATEKNRMDNLVANAPQALDTLKEISDQLAKDEQGASAILATQQQHTQQLATKVESAYFSASFDTLRLGINYLKSQDDNSVFRPRVEAVVANKFGYVFDVDRVGEVTLNYGDMSSVMSLGSSYLIEDSANLTYPVRLPISGIANQFVTPGGRVSFRHNLAGGQPITLQFQDGVMVRVGRGTNNRVSSYVLNAGDSITLARNQVFTGQTNTQYYLIGKSNLFSTTSTGGGSGGSGGGAVTVEQNLSSNSTTSVPSIKAINDSNNTILANIMAQYIPVSGTTNGVTVAGEIEIGPNGSFLYRDTVAGGFVRTHVEDGFRMEFVDDNSQNVNEIDFSQEGIYLTALGGYVQMLSPNGSLVSLTASNSGTLLVNGSPVAGGAGGGSATHPAPTLVQVDDVNKYMLVAIPPNYRYDEMEYSININSVDAARCTATMLFNGNLRLASGSVYRAAGTMGFRNRMGTGKAASAWVTNNVDFTPAAVAPVGYFSAGISNFTDGMQPNPNAGWYNYGGWYIANGVAFPDAGASYLVHDYNLPDDQPSKLRFSIINYVSGSLHVYYDGLGFNTYLTGGAGVYEFTIPAGAPGQGVRLNFQGNGSNLQIEWAQVSAA